MMTLNAEPRMSPPKNTGARAITGCVELLDGYPDLLTVQHLREITGQSAQTIRALINSGHLPGCRIGRRLYVPKSQFIAYIEKGI